MSHIPQMAEASGLVLIGQGSGSVADQVGAILHLLAPQGTRALCLLRAFYRPDTVTEADLQAEIATALGGRVRPVLSLVPVPHPGPGPVCIEAAAVRQGESRSFGGEGTSFALGIRRGIFAFTSAVRADTATGLVGESGQVMAGLERILQGLGAGFGDVVRMNRWYHAAGTKDEWEPSARAVARCYAEPGPIATALSLPAPLPGNRAIQIELMAMLAEDGTTLPKHHSWPEGHWDWPIHLPYKHGLHCGGLAFVGGQVSLDSRAEVIDPDDMDRQIARSMDNVARVLDGFAGGKRLMHLGIYSEHPPGGFDSGGAAATRLRLLARGDCPAVLVGFDYLSYPRMRVEIEAIAALT